MAIQRIVRLHFKEGKEKVFLNEILPKQKHFTRSFQGCNRLELWQDVDNEQIVYSFSLWDSVEDLNNYRYSDQFRAFWKATKQHFKEPAQAFSAQQIEVVNKI